MKAKNRESKDSGYVLVTIALLLFVLLGFVALAIDIGVLYSARTAAQRAADSAALAGALVFAVDTTPEEADIKAKAVASAAGKAADMVKEEMLKTQLKALEKAASEMKTGDLKAARESMKGLSRALVAIFESQDVKMPKRYTIIECPMVNERWIQDIERVSNPFMGSSMPLCGIKVGEIG